MPAGNDGGEDPVEHLALPDDPVGHLLDERGLPRGQPIEELDIVMGNAQGFCVDD